MNLGKTLKLLAEKKPLDSTQSQNIKIIRLKKSPPYPLIHFRAGIFIVLEGAANGLLGSSFYNFKQYKYYFLPRNVGLQVDGSVLGNKEFLGLALEMDLALIHDISSEFQTIGRPQTRNLEILEGHLDGEIRVSLEILLKNLLSTTEIKVDTRESLSNVFLQIIKKENSPELFSFLSRIIQYRNISNILNHMKKNYASPLPIRSLALKANMSIATLYRVFKRTTSLTPLQYKKMVRLKKSKDLLAKTNLNIKETSIKVGYKSVSQFSRDFKAYFGETPSEHSKKHQIWG